MDQLSHSLASQPYSAWADWLSKFHTWPEPIQALWLVAATAVVLGTASLLTRGLKDIVRLLLTLPPRGPREAGRLVYGVYEDSRGRWLVYRHGFGPTELDRTDPPADLIGPGEWGRKGD